ncbi:MAG: NAD(P)/FAD-dependent oxidoreductase [Acetobacteraceae bacterium]
MGPGADVAVIGAGNIGLAVAYYLGERHGLRNVVLIDARDPMSLTSAASGENYRNWWPHPVMTAFTNDSISRLEEIATASGNRIAMSRRGYVLVTRRTKPFDLIEDLYRGYGEAADRLIRVHEGPGTAGYVPPRQAAWDQVPDGVDVLFNVATIRETFPNFAPDAAAVVHIRRAGRISGQQLGQFMLERIRASGGRLLRGRVQAIETAAPFALAIETECGSVGLKAERVVNAAGPNCRDVALLLDEDVPIHCVFQQKIAFEDRTGAIPRTMPFTIDLDGQMLPWTEEERAILAEDRTSARLLESMPGGIHCRPDGRESGTWIKLGWAFKSSPSDPRAPEPIDAQFPDIVLRAASRLHPALKAYIGRLPRGAGHYGGYYAMTEENWPLIGPMRTPGAFIAAALSGFGTMAACMTGEICAAWIAGGALPAYAPALSLARYADGPLMAGVAAAKSRGVL